MQARKWLLICVLALCLILAAAPVGARQLYTLSANIADTTADTLAQTVLVHGQLKESPIPVPAGNHIFEINLFADSVGPEIIWADTQKIQIGDGGLFFARIHGPKNVHFKAEPGTLKWTTRYLQLHLISRNKTYERIPVTRSPNSLAATHVLQMRLEPMRIAQFFEEHGADALKAYEHFSYVEGHGLLLEAILEMHRLRQEVEELKARIGDGSLDGSEVKEGK